jgi:hypothetical protein
MARSGSTQGRNRDMEYRIWSFKHEQWWKPAGRGYTSDLKEAGQYETENAARLVERDRYGQNVAIAVGATEGESSGHQLDKSEHWLLINTETPWTFSDVVDAQEDDSDDEVVEEEDEEEEEETL